MSILLSWGLIEYQSAQFYFYFSNAQFFQAGKDSGGSRIILLFRFWQEKFSLDNTCVRVQAYTHTHRHSLSPLSLSHPSKPNSSTQGHLLRGLLVPYGTWAELHDRFDTKCLLPRGECALIQCFNKVYYKINTFVMGLQWIWLQKELVKRNWKNKKLKMHIYIKDFRILAYVVKNLYRTSYRYFNSFLNARVSLT